MLILPLCPNGTEITATHKKNTRTFCSITKSRLFIRTERVSEWKTIKEIQGNAPKLAKMTSKYTKNASFSHNNCL